MNLFRLLIRAKLLLLIASFVATVSIADPPSGREDQIVVRVLERAHPTSIELSGNGVPLLLSFSGDVGLQETLYRDRQLHIQVDGLNMRIEPSSITPTARWIRIVPDGPGAITLSASGAENRTYLGEIEIRVDPETHELMILNRVDLEDYVSSVVASEYGLKDEEGSKAMAVVVRTYALRAANSRTSDYDLVDDSRAQVYGGSHFVTDASRRAALETAGEALLFDGSLIQAVYSSSNGGKTAANESIWAGEPVPYLRGKNDPYDSVSPHSRWSVTLDREQLHRTLSERYSLTVTALRFNKSNRDGRVREVILRGDRGDEKTISGSSFRTVAGTITGQMKSTYFTVRERNSEYEIDGRGFGHGVGLSQWGAHGMALKGSDYRDILSFYYPGTRLFSDPTGDRLASLEASPTVLGWGGGWTDLHDIAVEPENQTEFVPETAVPTKEKPRRRIGW